MGNSTVSAPAPTRDTLTEATRTEALYLATRTLDVHPFAVDPTPAEIETAIETMLDRFGGPDGVATEYAGAYDEHAANGCLFELRTALKWCRRQAGRTGGGQAANA